MLKFAPFALLLALPVMAQDTAPAAPAVAAELTLDQSASLKCGVAFAIADGLRRDGHVEAAKYPDLGERGREFFVRTAAQIMEENSASRETVTAWARGYYEELTATRANLEAVFPACMAQLEMSGL